jgi:ABC-type branched-subunit amino acid transport system ATPase component
LEAADRAYVLTNGVITMTGSSAEFARNTDLITSSYLGGPT